MEVSDQLHALPTLPLVPIAQEVRWAQEQAWTQWQGEKSLPCPCWELNPGHPACSLVTILTELLQLTDILVVK
jgi:hypothetical protein